MEVGSEAWDGMNRLRWELIEKAVDHGIDGVESAELADLQRLSMIAVEGYPVEWLEGE